jgi:hypothetical protein
VGRTGKAEDKQRIRKRIQRLIDSFRSSASVEQFDYVAAEGKDTLTGDREVVDLLKERFIAQVDVDADVFNDPSRSAAEAIAILARQAQENEAFFRRTLPGITGSPDNSSVSEIIEDGAQAVSAAIGKMACEPVVTEAGKDVRPRAGIEASDVLVRG